MTSPFFIVVFALTAFVMTSTSGKDAVKNVDLAEELEKSRQALAKSHQESTQLRQESVKLRQDLEKSREETKRIIKKENQKLEKEAEKLRKENVKLRRQDEELRKEDAELKQRVHELHQDNSEIKRSLRQRDENNTVELQNFVRNSFGFRQMDFNSELEKTINKQIEKYLDEHRMCVSGVISSNKGRVAKIEFGQTFRRIPAFAAALSFVHLVTSGDQAYAVLQDFHVTNSSATIRINLYSSYNSHFNWIACL